MKNTKNVSNLISSTEFGSSTYVTNAFIVTSLLKYLPMKPQTFQACTL